MKINLNKLWSISWKVLLVIALVFAAVTYGLQAHKAILYHRYFCEYSDYDAAWPYSDSIRMHVKRGEYVQLEDKECGRALTPKLYAIYNGEVPDTLTVYTTLWGGRGYLNVYTGEVVLPAKWSHAWIFSEGLAAVVDSTDRMGFINHSGEWVIRPQYRYGTMNGGYAFHHGLCVVVDSCGQRGIIGKEGQWLLAPDSAYEYISVQEDGVIVRGNGRQWMLAHDLRTVLHPFVYDHIETFYVDTDERDEDGLRIRNTYEPIGYYTIGDKCGLLDRKTGRPLTPALYYDIDYVSDNVFSCTVADDYDAPRIHINALGEEVKK